MTVSISQFTHVDIPEGEPLATFVGGVLTIWPGGVGVGPAIRMTASDWASLQSSAHAAIETARR